MVLAASNFSHYKRRKEWAALAEQASELELRIEPDDWQLLRPLFRDADWLLKPGGVLNVAYPPGIRAQCEWDLWTLGQTRYHLENCGDGIRMTKQMRRLDFSEDPLAWSIAVISGGNNEARLERIFASVAAQDIPHFEVLVVGPAPKLTLPNFARHVPFPESESDPRFPITRKKNDVALHAKYENILVLHDRFRCSSSWYQGAKELRPDWDVLAVEMRFEGRPDSRLADWCSYVSGSPEALTAERVDTYDRVYPFDYSCLGVRQLPYSNYSPFIAVNGGAFAVKRHVLREVPLNSALHWAEIEDGDWSRQIHLRGKVVALGADCIVESLSDGRHSSATGSLAGRLATHAFTAAVFSRVRAFGFRTLQRAIDRLNRRQDFFTQRGFFSRRAITLTTPELFALRKVDWASVDVLYLRGLAERGASLREWLREIKVIVPRGKEVYFELATAGFAFFRRSGHLRNCESLCYEVGTYLGRDFECRFVLSTLQHNFVLSFQRTTEPRPYPLERIAVRATEPRLARFVAEGLGAEVVEGDAEDYDAVLLVGDVDMLHNPRAWRAAYERYGAVCAHRKGDRVLDGALLLAASEYRRAVGDWKADDAAAWRQAFETALIFAGVHPYNISGTNDYRAGCGA